MFHFLENLQSSTHYYMLGGRQLGKLQQSGSTSTTNYFLTDNLGSVLAVFNSVSSSAALLSTQLYAPYGASRFTAGTPSTYTTKGYTGQYNDSVSGLDYYNARYYDPVSGVFLFYKRYMLLTNPGKTAYLCRGR